jgi:predicted ester cyclase
MSAPQLVQDFYERIWNAGDLEAISDLLSDDCTFRGSLGLERRGRDGFAEYVQSVRCALSNYRCEILECVTEDNRAFAKMRFSGVHKGEFLGYLPTDLPVHWFGAALFRFSANAIADITMAVNTARFRFRCFGTLESCSVFWIVMLAVRSPGMASVV